MPTSVKGRPLIVSLEPTIEGSEAKYFCQMWWPITATAGVQAVVIRGQQPASHGLNYRASRNSCQRRRCC